MRYFTYLAEQAFVTNEQGHRLFYFNGAFARPYLVDDPDTESRLFWKLTWYYRIFFGTLLVVQPFLILLLVQQPWLFFGYLACISIFGQIAFRVLFRTDLRSLPRQESRSSLRCAYLSMAGRHSERALRLGFWTCVVFVIGSLICYWGNYFHYTIATFGILSFTLAAVGWGYALKLKKGAKLSDTSLARMQAFTVVPGKKNPEV